MLIARSVHPLPGEAELKERLLALIDGFSNRRVLVVGDLIADEFIYGEVARVSREAPGPHPQVRHDGDGGRRRRQRGQQRRRARRPRLARGHRRRRRRGAAAAREPSRGVDRRYRPAREGLPHAGQDAHPRRRRPLGQAAGRADRSRDRVAGAADDEPGVRADADAGAPGMRRRGPVRLRLGPRDAGAGGSASRAAGIALAATAGARPGRQPLPAARLPRPDDLHAERVRSRAGARRPHRRRSRDRSSGRDGRS